MPTSWTEASQTHTGYTEGVPQRALGEVTYLFGAIPITQAVFIDNAATWTEASVAATNYTEASGSTTSWTERTE